ncbi:hypothetical protein FRC01_002835, partial [Tulasnella sp. 417]
MEPLPYRLEADARQHIREHLNDHIQEHLSIKSDDYTIQEAEMLLSGVLRHVPLTGPTDVGPTRDFIESLSDDPHISELSLPDDRLAVSSHVLQWLKQLKTQLGIAACTYPERELSRFALDDSKSLAPPETSPSVLIYEASVPFSKPSSPNGTTYIKMFKASNANDRSRHGQLEEPTVNQEQVLSLRFSLDMRTKTEIGSLLSSLPASITSASRPTRAASSRRQDPTPTAITEFLSSDDPIPNISHRMSPPLFPRIPSPLIRKSRILENDLCDLHQLVGGKVDVEQDELDYVQESFKLVDGWSALPDFSSSTANSDASSPTSPQHATKDKNWFPSSDDPDVVLDEWRMEEVEFPRAKRIGQPISNLMEKATGISSMQDVVGDPVPGDAQYPPKWIHHPTNDAPLSVLGTAASNTEGGMDLDEVDNFLVQVYKDVQAQDPLSLILKEKLDQKDSSLMDVPDLHDPFMLAPTIKKGEIAAKYGDAREESLTFELSLKKVGGETTIPTLESAAGVDGELTVEPQSTEFLQETKKLFEPSTQELRTFEDFGSLAPCDPILSPTRDQRHEEILLTRLEARRLASTERNSAPQASDDEDDELDELEDSDLEMVDESIHKPAAGVQEFLRQQPFHPDATREAYPGYATQEQVPPDAIKLVAAPPPLVPQAPAKSSTLSASEPTSFETNRGAGLSSTVEPNEIPANSNINKLSQFLNLRGRSRVIENAKGTPPSPQQGNPPSPRSSPKHLQEPSSIPEEVLAQCSFHIDRKASRTLSQMTVYKYVATCDMIQKRGICQHLASNSIRVHLVERPNVADVDLIVDAGAAIIYYTLAALPVEAKDITERVSRLSAAYSRLLLVFEAYPPSKSRTAYLNGLDDSRIPRQEDLAEGPILPYAFSPPILKAFKHLRRSLVIAESTGEKLASCKVDIAFALDEEESAQYARIFGDARVNDCQTDSNSAMSGPWDDRSWLIDDAYEGEGELASFEGLNLFASISMLRLVNLDSIIDEMTSEQRLAYFANEIGQDRVLAQELESNVFQIDKDVFFHRFLGGEDVSSAQACLDAFVDPACDAFQRTLRSQIQAELITLEEPRPIEEHPDYIRNAILDRLPTYDRPNGCFRHLEHAENEAALCDHIAALLNLIGHFYRNYPAPWTTGGADEIDKDWPEAVQTWPLIQEEIGKTSIASHSSRHDELQTYLCRRFVVTPEDPPRFTRKQDTESTRPEVALILLSPGDYQDPDSLSWKDIKVPIEITLCSHDVPVDRTARYAHCVRVEQFDRNFLFTVTITRTEFWIARWDPTACYITPSINFHKDPLRFIHLVGRLTSMSPADLGYDPAFSNAGRVLHHQVAQSNRSIRTTLSITPCEIKENLRESVHTPVGKPIQYLLDDDLLCDVHEFLFGRSTRVWRAQAITDSGLSPRYNAIKQNWQSQNRVNEAWFYQQTRDIEHGIAHMVSFEDVHHTRDDLSPMETKHARAIWIRAPSSKTIRETGASEDDFPGLESVYQRVLVRLVLKEVGKPLSELQTPRQLVHVVRDIAVALEALYDRNILHCDISEGNILLSVEPDP